jgi:hypothetical protein
MIGIFHGRGIAERARAHAQIDVDFRKSIHLFSNGRNLNALGLFLCIALHADENGWAWPGRDLLRAETGIGTERALTNALKHLRELRIDGQRVLAHYREDRGSGQYGRSIYLIFPDIPGGPPPEQFVNLKEFGVNTSGGEPMCGNPPTVNPPTDEPLTVNHTHELEPSKPEPFKQIDANASITPSETGSAPFSVEDDNAASDADFAEIFDETPTRFASSPSRSEEDVKQGVLEATVAFANRVVSEPWLAWGNDHSEVKSCHQMGVAREQIQRFGYLLERECGVSPLWESKKRMRDWVTGLAELYLVSDGDFGVVREAARRLDQIAPPDGGRFALARPQSLFNMVSAIMSERARTPERDDVGIATDRDGNPLPPPPSPYTRWQIGPVVETEQEAAEYRRMGIWAEIERGRPGSGCVERTSGERTVIDREIERGRQIWRHRVGGASNG